MSSTVTDTELWDAVVCDSARAFTVLYNRHWRKLYKTAGYYLKDEFAAKEITHDVFLTLWLKRKTLKISNFPGYIHIAVRYHVFTYLKKAKIDCVKYIDEFAQTENPVVYNTIEDKLRYDDLKSELLQVLQVLPRRCQEIFWMSRVECLTNEEIANKLDISKRTVENQISIASKHLRVSYPELSLALVVIYGLLGTTA